MTDTSVLNLVIDKVNDDLEVALIEKVERTDDTRAGLVRTGLLQDDPTIYKVSVLSYSNDVDREDRWKHGVANYDIASASNPPGYEIGGGGMWFRRFTTKIEMYWKSSFNRQKARLNANVVLSRAEHTIKQVNMNGLADTFGEYATAIYVRNSELYEAGGQGQFITHAKIWWEVLTYKN